MRHYLYTLMGCLLLVSLTACEKDTLPEIFAPELATGTATNIYRKGATLSGSIQLTEGAVVEHYGILYSPLSTMEESKELEIVDGTTEFSILLQGLTPGKTYYFCTYSYSGYSSYWGEVRSFTTTENNAPIFEMPFSPSQTSESFTVSANLLDDGGSKLLLEGFCYNELGEGEPTYYDHVVNAELDGTSYSAEITELEPGKTYQVRAYAANENGLAYSEMLYVSTKGDMEEE